MSKKNCHQTWFEKVVWLLHHQVPGWEGVPVACMLNADLARLINSDEIQSVVNPAKLEIRKYAPKRNPIRNIEALEALDLVRRICENIDF